MCPCLAACLSVCLSFVYLSVYQPVLPSVCLSDCLFSLLPVCVFLSVYLCLSVFPSVFLFLIVIDLSIVVGAKTKQNVAGDHRKCKKTDRIHYPTMSPVGIVLVVDEQRDRCILARQPKFAANMYSCLAGEWFVLWLFDCLW